MKEWQEPEGKIKSFTEQDLTEEESESLGFRNSSSVVKILGS